MSDRESLLAPLLAGDDIDGGGNATGDLVLGLYNFAKEYPQIAVPVLGIVATLLFVALRRTRGGLQLVRA